MSFKNASDDYGNSRVYKFIVRFNEVAYGWFYRLLVKLTGKK